MVGKTFLLATNHPEASTLDTKGQLRQTGCKGTSVSKARLSVQIFILVGEGVRTKVRTGQGCKPVSEGGKVNKQ